MESRRKVERFNHGVWGEIPFSEIHEGDTIRMFEDEGAGVPVYDGKGNSIFFAVSDAYVNENGIFTVNIKDEINEEDQIREMPRV